MLMKLFLTLAVATVFFAATEAQANEVCDHQRIYAYGTTTKEPMYTPYVCNCTYVKDSPPQLGTIGHIAWFNPTKCSAFSFSGKPEGNNTGRRIVRETECNCSTASRDPLVFEKSDVGGVQPKLCTLAPKSGISNPEPDVEYCSTVHYSDGTSEKARLYCEMCDGNN